LDKGDGSQAWVDAGLKAMARGGVAEVRVEVVAQDLGVTKGGFYRRFRDRRALLDAMLADWTEGRIAAIAQQTDLAGMTPEARLKAVIQLFAERMNAEGLAIELAIRQWARTDEKAAEAAGRVDRARLAAVEALYARLGFTAAEARARGVLFYAFIFGQSLLFRDGGPDQHARLVAACADLLTEASSG
jgi:AcrR family transcriptional regulator